ncbi:MULTISPECIES: phage virion morphogenesis protein [Butyricimonas]|uniref:phage virion morphogenesis protein n=1 Tax=Butyricimonas TaxID=574697 RepID=UPI001D0866B9|nr:MULTISPECIES: phage virion morphogenesis protein [Butyricimonas]MCB6971838.1 phage virion morphogenesis protein [Butyricimonas synergistica]MCG4518846.1 phage virion morphogenesis protein [Butyricimonas sp. DFI.6.44]
MRDIQKFARDMKVRAVKFNGLSRKVTVYIAGAAEKMKDANFSAEGFISNGVTRSRWKKRHRETSRSRGKRVLFDTGTLQNSVKAKTLAERVSVGVDLTKVPYAKAHNEGGRIIQYVRPFTRKRRQATNIKTHRRVLVGGQKVRGFVRRLNMPRRQFLGYSPDIIKSANKDIQREIDKILKTI